jgi:hypothetical protein
MSSVHGVPIEMVDSVPDKSMMGLPNRPDARHVIGAANALPAPITHISANKLKRRCVSMKHLPSSTPSGRSALNHAGPILVAEQLEIKEVLGTTTRPLVSHEVLPRDDGYGDAFDVHNKTPWPRVAEIDARNGRENVYPRRWETNLKYGAWSLEIFDRQV